MLHRRRVRAAVQPNERTHMMDINAGAEDTDEEDDYIGSGGVDRIEEVSINRTQ
jgi:hypothetical protein